jgi:glycosyltransferase involved in cell wall biosynthesis
LRIAINTRFLLTGRPLEGLGRYTYEIARNLVLSHPEHEFYFFFDRVFDPKFIFAENVHPIVVSPQARHPFLFYLWFEIQIPRYLAKHKIDVFFSPDNFLSLSTNCPTILTIHDIVFLYYPQFMPLVARKHYQFFIPKFLKRADHILPVSEAVKKDVMKHYDIDENKITTVYNALPSSFESIKNNHEKKENYFIVPGSINPRKNTLNILKAFELFCKTVSNDYQLKVVGKFMGKPDDELMESWNRLESNGKLLHLRNLSDEEMIIEIQRSKALLYISLFEGFGIPILEGMACGTPVITSNVTSMPEVAGDAAILVDPLDVTQITNALESIIKNTNLTNELIEKGRERIKHFSYKQSAIQVYNIIEQLHLEKINQ